jgi:hypothetical protein
MITQLQRSYVGNPDGVTQLVQSVVGLFGTIWNWVVYVTFIPVS